jgi:hypothetical protein
MDNIDEMENRDEDTRDEYILDDDYNEVEDTASDTLRDITNENGSAAAIAYYD